MRSDLLGLTAALCLTILGLATGTSAKAQGIDYNRLETLFEEPVITSATGKPQRASDAPATVDIITAEQIRRSGATDIPTLLQRLPGIDVYRASLDGPDVSIRGYTAPMTGRILVLVDGRQVYNDSWGFISWGLLPVDLEEIRQIEVIKGPQSALYGFNAAAGVINIITQNPLDQPINSLRLSGGSQAYRDASAITTLKPTDHSAVRLAVAGFDADDSGNRPDPIAAQNMAPLSPNRHTFHADAVTRLDDGDQLGLDAAFVSGQERRLTSWYSPMLLREQIASIKANWTGSTPIGLLSAQAYRNDFRTHADLPGGFPSGDFNNDATVASLSDLFKPDPDNTIRLSADYRRNASTIYGHNNAGLGYDVWSGSVMWDTVLSPSLTLTNAVRFDDLQLGRWGPINPDVPFTRADYDRTLTAYSFNSGLVWRFDTPDALRLNAGRGYTLPTLSQFGAWETQQTSANALEYGNPGVNPSEVWNTELSWDHDLSDVNGSSRIGVFFQRTANIIDFAPAIIVTPQNQIQLPIANVGASRTMGLEAGLHGKLAPAWDWSTNYTFQAIRDAIPQRSPLISPNLSYAERTPHHKLNVHIGYTVGRWNMDLDASYLARYALPDFNAVVLTGNNWAETPLGQFVLLSPRVAFHLTDTVTAEVAAQGLWRRQDLPLSVLEPRVLFSLTGRW